jgi:hypothetical protein
VWKGGAAGGGGGGGGGGSLQAKRPNAVVNSNSRRVARMVLTPVPIVGATGCFYVVAGRSAFDPSIIHHLR